MANEIVWRMFGTVLVDRPGQSEAMANVATFLASPAGSHAASTLTGDGGLSKTVALGA